MPHTTELDRLFSQRVDRAVPKERGEGPTTIDFTCGKCGNEWTASAHWEGERILLDDDAALRCGNCGDGGRT